MKKQKGITLIALIITIIVLLILAVVAISGVSGDGIIKYAQDAKNDYTIAQEKEQIGLAQNEWSIQKFYPTNTQSFKAFMKSKLVDTGIATSVDGNDNGPLTITMKSENVYTVDENGNITEQENGEDKITNDFEITVSQSASGWLRIEPTIPGSWNDREFTEADEDLAAQIVGDYTYLKINGEKVTNLKELIIAGVNDEYGDVLSSTLGKTFSKDDYDTMIPIMQSMLPGDVDISTPQKAFEYMMQVMGEEYKTVQEFAEAVYQYEPTTKILKIRKDGGEWTDITEKATWNEIEASYQVNAIGVYEMQLELDDKKSISAPIEVDPNLGKYVKYDANGDGTVEDETILWRVLRNDKDKVELITADALGNLDLKGSDFDETRIKYNNAIDLMVAECKRVTGITENIRNVGGPAIDATTMNDTIDFSELAVFRPTVSIEEFNKYEGTENGFKKGDEEEKYLEDYNQMQKAGIDVADNSVLHWFASRNVGVGSKTVSFNVYTLGSIGGVGGSYVMCQVHDDTDTEYNNRTGYAAVRPVLTLESRILDNAAQTGTKDDPIEIYQNK